MTCLVDLQDRKWFGIDHYPGIQPDIVAIAKGLTSGYVPLGEAMVNGSVAEYFENEPLAVGLTNTAHPVGCAAALANIEVYRDEDLIGRSASRVRCFDQGWLTWRMSTLP